VKPPSLAYYATGGLMVWCQGKVSVLIQVDVLALHYV
jgi:hypothetical protein